MLIHDDTYDFADVRLGWTTWLLAAGVEGVDPTRGLRFAQSVFVLQAAVDGLGVALGRVSLAADDTAAGRLVCPFPTTMPLDLAYYVVGPEVAFTTPKACAFREWLVAEIAESEHGLRNHCRVLDSVVAGQTAPSAGATRRSGRSSMG